MQAGALQRQFDVADVLGRRRAGAVAAGDALVGQHVRGERALAAMRLRHRVEIVLIEPRRMLDKQPYRIRALADQPQRLVNDVEMIQRIVIANHRAQIAAIEVAGRCQEVTAICRMAQDRDGARIAFVVNPAARQGHDRGTIDAAGRSEAISELEIELAGAPVDALFDLAGPLVRSGRLKAVLATVGGRSALAPRWPYTAALRGAGGEDSALMATDGATASDNSNAQPHDFTDYPLGG